MCVCVFFFGYFHRLIQNVAFLWLCLAYFLLKTSLVFFILIYRGTHVLYIHYQAKYDDLLCTLNNLTVWRCCGGRGTNTKPDNYSCISFPIQRKSLLSIVVSENGRLAITKTCNINITFFCVSGWHS